VVDHGVAEKTVEGDSLTGHHHGVEYYAKVFVDGVVDGWADLELEVPGLMGKRPFKMLCILGFFGPKLT
jgi:hypothetical protein